MKRFLSVCLCLLMLLPLIAALPIEIGAETTAKFTVTNADGEATTTFTYGEPIMVTPLVGEGTDWIGIAPKGKVGSGSVRYKRIVKDSKDGRVGSVGMGLNVAVDIRTGAAVEARFESADIAPGEWTVFWCVGGGSARDYDQASAIDITVTAGPMTVNKTTFVVGEPILVTATKQENAKDKSWYGIVPCDDNGTPKKSFGTMIWRDADDTQDDLRETKDDTAKTGVFGEAMRQNCATWMNEAGRAVDWGGEVSKKHLTSLPVGTYWLVYCWDSSTLYKTQREDGKTVTHAIQIRIEPCIEVKETYAYGEPITVTAHTPAANCHVFISPKHEDVHTNYWSIRWQTIASAGTNTFDIRKSGTSGNYPHLWELPPGDYSLYMVFAPDSKATAANHATRVNITISGEGPLAPTAAEYSFDKTTGLAGGTLSVTVDADALNNSYNKPTHILTYWGDESGNKLPQYTYIGLRKVTGVTTNITVPPATVIPDEAKTLLVYAYNGSGASESCVKITLPADRKVVTEQEKGKLLTSFQIVSDVHTQDAQTDQFNKNIARMLEDIKLNDPDSAGIFIAGDAVNDGREVEYENLYELWEQSGLSAPIFMATGNHEYKLGDAANSYTSFYNEEKERFIKYANQFLSAAGRENIENGLPYYDLWVNGFHYIFLASEAAITHAYLSDAQLNWLDEMLAEDRDANRPSFILIHQGLYNTIDGGMPRQDWDGVIAGDAAYRDWKSSGVWKTRGQYEQGLRDILKKYPEAMMFSGHTHWDMTEYNNYYDPTAPTDPNNALPNYLFNTAAVAYLVTGYYDDGVSYDYNQGWYAQTYTLYGETHLKWDDSKGYYLRVYENCIEIYGREFSSSQWVPNAMYRLNKAAEIAPNEHEGEKACSENCKYCGESITPAQPHQGLYSCSTTCRWCGTELTPGQHRVEHPCSEVCADCGAPVTPQAKHQGDRECSDHCNVCDQSFTPYKNHEGEHGCSTVCKYGCGTAVEATARHQGLAYPCSDYCTDCETYFIPYQNHVGARACSDICKYGCGTAVNGKEHEGLHACSEICRYGRGTAVIPTAVHEGAVACHSTTCKNCGAAVTPLPHAGEFACSEVCRYGCGQRVTPTSEHDFGEWEIIKEPTATTDGEQKHKCAVCPKVETQKIEALGADNTENGANTDKQENPQDAEKSGGSTGLVIGIVAGVVVLGGGAAAAVVVAKKKKAK